MIYVMSGGTKLYAAIGVTYPKGSTCTCSNGKKTLKAKDTSGQWVFAVPSAGTWTVTATDGTNTKSQSVTISNEGQNEKVRIAYSFALFAGGSGLAVGYSATSLPSGANTVSTSAITIANSNTQREILYIKPAVDCSGFSKITVKGQQTDSGGGSGSTLTVGLVKSLPTGTADSPAFVASAVFDMNKLNTEQTLTVDLNAVSGDCYFAVCAYYVAPGRITSVVFE